MHVTISSRTRSLLIFLLVSWGSHPRRNDLRLELADWKIVVVFLQYKKSARCIGCTNIVYFIYTKFDKIADTVCIDLLYQLLCVIRLVNLSMIFNTSRCNSSQLTLDLASSWGKWWARPIPSGQTIVNLGPDRLASVFRAECLWFFNMKRHHSPELQTMKIVEAFLNQTVGTYAPCAGGS